MIFFLSKSTAQEISLSGPNCTHFVSVTQSSGPGYNAFSWFSKMAEASVLLFLLYFGQGLPYGFQVKLLPLLLRKQSFSLSRVGFSRLLSLPWIFKFTVAPFVDNFWSLDLWILFGSMAMAILCFTSAIVGFGNIIFLLLCVFLMNLTSAVQDVAVDTFAISLLKPSDLGEFG